MLTGKLPFTSSSVKGKISQIMNKLIDFDTLNISSMAKKFLLGLLEKNPIKRLTPE
jgi:serine/threonine protein kinase